MENCHKTIEKSTFDNAEVQKTIEKPGLYKHHSPEIIGKPNKIIEICGETLDWNARDRQTQGTRPKDQNHGHADSSK